MYDSSLTFLPWSQPIGKQKLLNLFILTVAGKDIFSHRHFKKWVWPLNFTFSLVSGKIFNNFSCNYVHSSPVIQLFSLFFFFCFTLRSRKCFWYEIESIYLNNAETQTWVRINRRAENCQFSKVTYIICFYVSHLLCPFYCCWGDLCDCFRHATLAPTLSHHPICTETVMNEKNEKTKKYMSLSASQISLQRN